MNTCIERKQNILLVAGEKHVYLPGDEVPEGETLVCDFSVYDMLADVRNKEKRNEEGKETCPGPFLVWRP